MYSHPYIKIIKTNDGGYVIETEEKYKVKPKKKGEISTVKYDTKHYIAKNINELMKKLKSIIPKLKSVDEEYEESFAEAVEG